MYKCKYNSDNSNLTHVIPLLNVSINRREASSIESVKMAGIPNIYV